MNQNPSGLAYPSLVLIDLSYFPSLPFKDYICSTAITFYGDIYNTEFGFLSSG